MKLKVFDHIPDELLSMEPWELYDKFSKNPFLINLEGRREERLFISTLSHGNETTGYLAARELLRRHALEDLPRCLSVFVGNVKAAKEGKRVVDGQLDFNRVWNGGDSEEHKLARQVLDEGNKGKIFAAIDIHNNTGINPHYSAVTAISNRSLQLATLFSRTVAYYRKPDGTHTEAMTKLCPAITLECGKPGNKYGTEHALSFLEGVLRLDHLPETPVHEHDIDLFHTVAVVKVPDDVSFSFGGGDSDIVFREDLDHLNFRPLPVGTVIATVKSGFEKLLSAWDDYGCDMGKEYFVIENEEMRLAKEVMPSMFTLNSEIIRQDCLGYFMERVIEPK